MPNPNTISWLHYQDIQIPDDTIYKQFKAYMNSGQYQQGIDLLNANVQQLTGKAYLATTINTIIAGILTLESQFNDAVNVFLDNLAQEYIDLINSFIKKGNWESNTEYKLYNFVVYQNDLYMCIEPPPIGTLPTDETYWLFLGLRGKDGEPGLDINFKFEWSSITAYSTNDVVIYNHDAYVAIADNTNIIPTSDPSKWQLFISIGINKIHVGVAPPSNPVNNMVWFQTDTDPAIATSITPILGQFKRYIASGESWEDMMPNVLYRWIDGYEGYAEAIRDISLVIRKDNWVNGKFDFNYPRIQDTSIVTVWPDVMNDEQYQAFSSLGLFVEGSIMHFTTYTNIEVDIPIIINIQ